MSYYKPDVKTTGTANNKHGLGPCNSTAQNDELLSQNVDLHSCSLPNAVESMFSDWKKSPQQRLAELVEALTLSSTLEEEKEQQQQQPTAGKVAAVPKEKKCYPSCLEKTVKEGINKSVSCDKQACKCHSGNPTVDSTLGVSRSGFFCYVFTWLRTDRN